ncbi:MAG: nucleotidyl transferase AbiEii/AbiGii toxin family protein [Nitrospirota bacterium]
MKPLRIRLEEVRKRTGLSWDILEKDYILSWVLAGISRVDALRDTLIFKGGTALKKCYFGDYRFSEDLDFSAVGNVPTGESMEKAIQEACTNAVKLLEEYAPVEIVCERYTEREPHPGGQEAFLNKGRALHRPAGRLMKSRHSLKHSLKVTRWPSGQMKPITGMRFSFRLKVGWLSSRLPLV